MTKVEVGFKLDKDYLFYKELLESNGLQNTYNCTTRDIYYTNKSLDNMTEHEMKCACIRLRNVNDSDFKVQNNYLDKEYDIISKDNLESFELELKEHNINKVLDTKKLDHHFKTNDSTIQLQEIENIGLVVYYDNPKYYELDIEEQRINLIKELKELGFTIDEKCLCIDKMRTLYNKKEMYSKFPNL